MPRRLSDQPRDPEAEATLLESDGEGMVGSSVSKGCWETVSSHSGDVLQHRSVVCTSEDRYAPNSPLAGTIGAAQRLLVFTRVQSVRPRTLSAESWQMSSHYTLRAALLAALTFQTLCWGHGVSFEPTVYLIRCFLSPSTHENHTELLLFCCTRVFRTLPSVRLLPSSSSFTSSRHWHCSNWRCEQAARWETSRRKAADRSWILSL